ncbi:response regulator [Pontixanthobacter aestiaquae]|uniref:Response regulator n=1 Tax=Pontixanthobacter aestiaquae TaxID=1509367 RepID=A0A844Z6R9_9SPHN|nr:response regulator [Pontixanthobacter aestiaquae]MDN3646459.1 response regulator [Pontixanthobacter aestiaquae]MXO82553.1 response regulator [Pontixanthobacter aestiaquae]
MGKVSATRKPLAVPQRVLVVEDDAILSLSIEQILVDAGVPEIRVCQTTTEAVQLLKTMRPDALVLDVHLADRDDGYSIAELVAALKPNAPKIVFSTGTPDDIPPQVARLGTVLEKPYGPDDLVKAVSRKQTGLKAFFSAKA